MLVRGALASHLYCAGPASVSRAGEGLPVGDPGLRGAAIQSGAPAGAPTPRGPQQPTKRKEWQTSDGDRHCVAQRVAVGDFGLNPDDESNPRALR